ncbi:MAG: GNAT family N-acetyltransferase [Cyanobacteria bacterium P01_H01_bin.119]
MEVLQAGLNDLEILSQLFDQYRVFYQSPSNLEAAKAFLKDRLQKGDSTIFLASDNGQKIGFTQLYPSFSSVSMNRIWILNDLFVAPDYRNQGVGKRLLTTAKDFAKGTGALYLSLATQASNAAAQSLYRSVGYCKDEEFYHYSLSLE